MRPALTPAQAKAKNAYLLKNYHITYVQYEELRAHQNYACAICHLPENKFKTGMAVDHCHTAGTVRGLLCWKCNRALGKFRDDAQLLANAANYINFPPTFVLWGQSPVTAAGRVGSKARNKAIAKLNGQPAPKRRKRAKRKSGKSSAGRTKRTVKI
jgi:hypothetical protein